MKKCVSYWKAGAILAAAVMAAGNVGVTLPVIAATPAAVAETSGMQDENGIAKGTITVAGVTDDGVTVKAYKLVTGYYKDGKLVKYVQVDPANAPVAAVGDQTKGQTKDTDPDNSADDKNDIITEEELAQAAGAVQSGAYTVTETGEAQNTFTLTKGNDGNYTASVTPGLYMILVTGVKDADAKVYNPGVVAVNVSDVNAGTVEGSTVDFSHFFTTTDGTTPSKVYLKSSLGADKFDKKIANSVKLAAEAEKATTGENPTKIQNGHGDTVAFGDTIHYTMSGLVIPSFSKDYTAKHYYITDKLTPAEGFTGITNIVVTDTVSKKALIAGQDYDLQSLDGKGAFDTGDKKSFRITLKDAYLDAHRADAKRPTLTITYETKLTGKAGVNFSENLNHAELHFSNDPSDETGGKEHVEKVNTYHYTFTVDGLIDGQSGSKDETYELNKVTKAHDNYTKGVSASALEGATFGLYSDEACTKPVKARMVNEQTGEVTTGTDDYTSVSDKNGHFSFAGLDEGTYYVKETLAPAGYGLSDAVYKFVITAEMDETSGILNGYSVKTYVNSESAGQTGFTTEAGSAEYKTTAQTEEDGTVTNAITGLDDTKPMEVVDTKTQNLPSTGGIGNTWFYLVGIGGMAGAAVVFAAVKKSKKEE